MRKNISILTTALLVLVTPLHLWWAFGLYFWTYPLENILLCGVLLAAIAPPVVLVRRFIGKPWSNADLVLAGMVVLPGAIVGMETLLADRRFHPLFLFPLAVHAVIFAGSIYLKGNPPADEDRVALLDQRPATEEEFASSYRQMFAERGGTTSSDSLEFHLYHLARYWSRLVGFCRLKPGPPEFWADGSMGIAIRIANRFTDPLVDSASPLIASWNSYKQLAEKVLHRHVLLDDVEAASDAFDRFLAETGYSPWPIHDRSSSSYYGLP